MKSSLNNFAREDRRPDQELQVAKGAPNNAMQPTANSVDFMREACR
jgi:hypothetical protein